MSDNEVDPIAWMRENGNVVIRHTTTLAETPWCEWDPSTGRRVSYFTAEAQKFPTDAVPLVPATEIDEANAEIREWIEHANRLDARSGLPALDRPEALRYAGDVIEACEKREGRPWLALTPQELHARAGYMEAAARADADRDKRAQELHLAYINGTTGIGLKWDLLTDGQRNGWRAVADHLDSSQAKAAS